MRKVLYILGHFTDDDISWMLDVGRRKEVETNVTLIEEGNQVEEIYIVTDGKFEVELPGFGTVAQLHSGEILGEMSFLDEEPPTVNVKALEPSKVFAIDYEDLRDRFEDEPAFEARFFRAIALFLSLRLRGTSQKLGYGKTESNEMPTQENELDMATLKRVQVAGERFNRMLEHLK